MKPKKMLNDIKIQLLFTLYVYALFKIILFKFGAINMRFLWQQLKLSLGNPDYISRQFHKGNLIPFTLSLGLSLILESAQALFSIGSFDVDDLILNSSGGLIGFIICKLIAKLVATPRIIQARGRPI